MSTSAQGVFDVFKEILLVIFCYLVSGSALAGYTVFIMNVSSTHQAQWVSVLSQ